MRMLARICPESKRRHCTVGPTDQKRLPALNQSERLMLCKPTSPVNENFGKRSATATPMRAVAAANCRSDWRLSGRGWRKLAGRPTGTTGGEAGMGGGGNSSGKAAGGGGGRAGG